MLLFTRSEQRKGGQGAADFPDPLIFPARLTEAGHAVPQHGTPGIPIEKGSVL